VTCTLNGETFGSVTLQVSFSRHLIAETPKPWMDVILHEIAHAIAGPEHPHDSTWQLICRAVGGSGERYHAMVLVEPKWALECVDGCWRRPCLRRSLLHRKCPECGSPCKYIPKARLRYHVYCSINRTSSDRHTWSVARRARRCRSRCSSPCRRSPAVWA
jgi:hypothetical protein